MYKLPANLDTVNEPEENYKKGYIKLFRTIDDHWLMSNPHYYQAFTRMIMKANHTKDTILIEGEIITCDRGQTIYSLNSWVDIFNKKLSKRYWSIQKVRTFFKILQSDNMILQKGLRKTTRVTICNYDSYQDNQQTANKEVTSSQQGDNKEVTTSKELKELKELNISTPKEFYKKELLSANGLVTEYSQFIKILFGVNDLGYELSGVLSIKKQVTYLQFEKLWDLKKKYNKGIAEILTSIENDKKYWKGKTDLYRTLRNWLKNDFK